MVLLDSCDTVLLNCRDSLIPLNFGSLIVSTLSFQTAAAQLLLLFNFSLLELLGSKLHTTMTALAADAGQHAVNSFVCCGGLYFVDAGQ